MKKLKCYYAHTMLSYNSTIEEHDIQLLNKLGFEVINPNNPFFQTGCEKFAAEFGKEFVMDFFKAEVLKCDLIAFRALPGGDILSGVSAELQAALDVNMPIIEFPTDLTTRRMNSLETKEYLYQIGYRKVKNGN